MECIGIPIYIIYNMEVIYMFDFNYDIKDWNKRKENVENFIKDK